MHQLFIDYVNETTPTEGAAKLFREIVKRTSAKKLSETNKELAKNRKKHTSIDSKLNNALEALLEDKIDASKKARYSKALMKKRSQIEQQAAELGKFNTSTKPRLHMSAILLPSQLNCGVI